MLCETYQLVVRGLDDSAKLVSLIGSCPVKKAKHFDSPSTANASIILHQILLPGPARLPELGGKAPITVWSQASQIFKKLAMPSTPADSQSTLETIDLLQYRLQRLEYLLTGSDDGQDELRNIAAQGKDHGVLARLAKVESELARLASKSSFVNDILQLREVRAVS